MLALRVENTTRPVRVELDFGCCTSLLPWPSIKSVQLDPDTRRFRLSRLYRQGGAETVMDVCSHLGHRRSARSALARQVALPRAGRAS